MLTVRAATAADADEIARVQVETWRAAYTGLMPDEVLAQFGMAMRQEQWRRWLGEEHGSDSSALVAELDGGVVGFAWVGDAGDEPEGVGELYAIYVEASRWGTGAGRALLERAEEDLRALGFREAMLWVLEGNVRAERFYRAAGWAPDGGRKQDDFQGARVSELRYRKPLREGS